MSHSSFPSVLLLFGLLAAPAGAMTYDVTRTDDPTPDGCMVADCSLREAILAANLSAGHDTIQLGAATYTLALTGTDDDGGDLDIKDTVTIEGIGVGASVIDADGVDRVFDLHPTAGVVTMNNLTLTGGLLTIFEEGSGIRKTGPDVDLFMTDAEIIGNRSEVQGAGALVNNGGSATLTRVLMENNFAAGFGGAIVNFTTLEMTDCIIRNNTADNESAISGRDHSTTTLLRVSITDNTSVFQSAMGYGLNAVLDMDDSTVSRNIAGSYPGGILLADTGTGSVTINNSTISDNQAAHTTAGIYLTVGAVATITNSTITQNPDDISAIWIEEASTLNLRDSIVVSDCVVFFDSTLNSLGGNVESPWDTCELTHPSDQDFVNSAQLNLLPLANYGGANETRVVGSNSVARGSAVGPCPDFDQRGIPRGRFGSGAGCDSGATEHTPCQAPGLAIPDNNMTGITNSLTLTEQAEILDMDLFVGISHGNVGDLTVELAKVDAASGVVLDQPVNGSMASCTSNDLSVFFDDEAITPIESSCADNSNASAFPLTTYQPGDPAGAVLTAFDGAGLNGTWELTVRDLAATTAGTLDAWCLLPATAIFTDGFESGDTSAWSSSFP